MSRQGVTKDERGFTPAEVMIVIVTMGIVFAIASSSWFSAVESRRVDAATNQLAADLRHAHSKGRARGGVSGAVMRTLVGESPLDQELAMKLLVRLARERGEGVVPPEPLRATSSQPAISKKLK